MLMDFRKFLVGTACLLLLFSSCKEEGIIGLDVQPEGDLLNVVYNDTTPIIAYTIKDDSLRTDLNSLYLIGSYIDPIFGLTSTSLYTQFFLPKEGNAFHPSTIVDSVVLSLAYDATHYGTLESQNFKVYELTEALNKDSAYYSSQNLDYNPTPLASYSFTPAPTTKVYIGGDTLSPQLRIPLPMSYGTSILNSPTVIKNDDFIAAFKGLYITPDNLGHVSGQGAILRFNLISASTKLRIYYHDTIVKPPFELLINSSTKRFNHFEHNYTSADPLLQAQLSDSTLGQNMVYIQPLSGLKAKVNFSEIKNLIKENKIVVNKAEIIVQVDPANENTSYPLPSKLRSILPDSTGKEVLVLSEASKVNQSYILNVTRYIQTLLENEVEEYIYLVPNERLIAANRAILGGPANTSYKMKLSLTYTKIE